MKVITALILSVTTFTAQAEETVKVAVNENSCWADARELAKTGFNYQEHPGFGSGKIAMFQTKTHYVTASCSSYDKGYMTIRKISNAEMATVRKDSAAKTASIAKQAGL